MPLLGAIVDTVSMGRKPTENYNVLPISLAAILLWSGYLYLMPIAMRIAILHIVPEVGVQKLDASSVR